MKVKLYIEKYPKKIIEVAEIIRSSQDNYEAAALDVRKLVEEGTLIPLKASGLNGRSPVLYNKYKIVSLEKDYTAVSGKIRLLHAIFDHQYYFTHPEQYLSNAEEIEALSDLLWNRSMELQ